MKLTARTARIWAVAIGATGVLDSSRVVGAAFVGGGHTRAAAGWAGFCMAHRPILVVLVLACALAWYRFVRRADQLVWGAAAFGLLWLVVRIWTTAYSTGHQDFIQSGAVMLGWLLGAVWGRALGYVPSRSEEERLEVDRHAAAGALALFAATYVCSGVSKLLNSDLGWAGAVTIRLMAASHLAVDDTSWLAGLKRALAHDPHAGTVLQHATIVVQCGAVVVLFGRRARAVWCSALVLLHTGIYLTSGIQFFTPLLLAAVFAVPWDRRASSDRSPDPVQDPAPAPVPDPARARRVMLAAIAGTGSVLALLWLTPLGPALRFQVQPWQVPGHAGAADLTAAPAAPPPASPAVRALLGDLSDGEEIAGCILRGVTGPAEGRLTLVFDCPGGPATLWVVRRGSTPFLAPSSTARLDVMTQGNDGAAGPTPAELTALVSAVTRHIVATGEKGELPAGL